MPQLPDQRIIKPRRQRRLRAVRLLPTVATLGNLVCGFLAMMCGLLAMREAYFEHTPDVLHPQLAEYFPTYVSIGVYLIVLALIFDALDGRLARLTRRTSEFGAQLDSISDVVSFGVAPVVLLLAILLPLAVPSDGTPVVSKYEWRVALLCAIVYVSCAAIRLARFNVENTHDALAKKKFSGLPVPGGAIALVALLLLHEDLGAAGRDATVVRLLMLPAAFVLGLLMTSRLDYVHVFNMYVQRKHPPMHLVWLVVIIGIGWHSPPLLLAVLAYAYVLSGLLLNLRRDRRRGESRDDAGEHAA